MKDNEKPKTKQKTTIQQRSIELPLKFNARLPEALKKNLLVYYQILLSNNLR